MSGNNIKMSFSYDIHEMMETKNEDAWYLYQIKIIIDTTKMRRKKGWIENLEDEMLEHLEGVTAQESHNKVILNVGDIFGDCILQGNQEKCYKFATMDLVYRESLLKKFKIKNYKIVYEFQTDLCFIEEMKKALGESGEDTAVYKDDDIDNGEEPF